MRRLFNQHVRPPSRYTLYVPHGRFLTRQDSCQALRVRLKNNSPAPPSVVPPTQSTPSAAVTDTLPPAPPPPVDLTFGIGLLHHDVIARPQSPPGPAICLYSPLPPRPPSRHARSLSRKLSSIMPNWLQVVVSPTADTCGTGVILRGERRTYFFGRVCEATQRAVTQRGVSLTNFGNFFLTGPVGCDSAGGLLGALLTVTDTIASQRLSILEGEEKKRIKPNYKPREKNIYAGVLDRIDVHGGHNLNYYFATGRHFVFRYGVPVKLVEHRADPRLADPARVDPDWQDDSLMVWKIPLKPATATAAAAGERPRSRKRSHDEANEVGDAKAEEGRTAAVDPEEQDKLDLRAIEAIVEQMFGSTWNRDLLVESKLGDVDLPATVFVKDESGAIRKYDGPMPGDEGFGPDTPVWVREPWPAAKCTNLPPTAAVPISMCYVARHQPRRGKFNAKLAQELNIPKPLYRVLCLGESVEVDGRTIHPDQVLDAPFKGHGFAFLDLPSADYVPAFLARPEFAPGGAVMDTVKVMVWHLGPGLVDDPGLQRFMRDRPDIEHVVSSPETSPNMLTFESAGHSLTQFLAIDQDRFPALSFDNATQRPSEGMPFRTVRVGQTYKVMPQYLSRDDEIVRFADLAAALRSLPPAVRRRAELARELVRSGPFLDEVRELEWDIPNRDAEITALGTGSSLPSKYRNVSATLVRVPGYGSYLLDCGEGTLGQIRRSYGPDRAAEILRDLKCIVVSHGHADHHLGSASVIRAWAAETEKEQHGANPPTLAICCADNMQRFFIEYARIEDIALPRLRFIAQMAQAGAKGVFRQGLGPDDPTGLSGIVRVLVDHCKYAYATVLEWPSGLRIAYSGDCRPSDRFAEAARDCTLLVHEATLDDTLQADAYAKKHCTMSEALQVARDMRARRVLLTHFSQRFSKMPNMEGHPNRRRHSGNPDPSTRRDKQIVLVAFDMMRVKLGEFRHAQAFVPALDKYFNIRLKEQGAGDLVGSDSDSEFEEQAQQGDENSEAVPPGEELAEAGTMWARA